MEDAGASPEERTSIGGIKKSTKAALVEYQYANRLRSIDKAIIMLLEQSQRMNGVRSNNCQEVVAGE